MKLDRVLVLGASSAIALAVLRRLVAGGTSVYCVARDPDRLQAVMLDLRARADPGQTIGGQAADLLQTGRHAELFAAAEAELGPLDGVLIAHGTLPDQAACQSSVDETLAAIEVNGTSVVSLLTVAAGLFEARGVGVIAAISSVAGDLGRGSNYVYGASKALVTTFMQGLRHRFARTGIRVVIVKPGFVDTPMTAGIAPKGPLWATPEAVARDIVSALEHGRGQCYTPWYWRWIMLVLRHLPTPLFDRLRI